MKTFLMIIFSSLVIQTFGQSFTNEISKEVNNIVDSIIAFKTFTGEKIGLLHYTSPQYKNFEKFEKLASTKELSILLNHPNGIIRCYSFWAISNRDSIDIFDILKKHISDNELIKTLHFDMFGVELVSDIFINIATDDYPAKGGYKLNDYQLNILDSLLLYRQNIHTWHKNKLLERIKPNEKHYERIKEIAYKEENVDGLVALAKYQKDIDKELIKSYIFSRKNLYHTLLAIREFPDQEFYPFLIQIHDEQIQKGSIQEPILEILYQALARFPNENTLHVMNDAIKNTHFYTRKVHKKYILLAIRKYPNNKFSDLEKKIRLPKYWIKEIEINNE
ncbi:hypothetical protein [uncultured Draconibacterium sp.]|uniref:hypothetical protein n=1 Tax=uncultured Draconibacterium sp. TaxID=1573823 RepID=UPI003216D037